MAARGGQEVTERKSQTGRDETPLCSLHGTERFVLLPTETTHHEAKNKKAKNKRIEAARSGTRVAPSIK